MKERKVVPITEEAFNIAKKYHEQSKTRLSFTQWFGDKVVSTFKKEEWLKNNFPHIDFVEIIDNNLVIRDKNLKNPYVEVKYKDKHLWCSYCNENHCGHVYYCIARPEVAILEEIKKKK